MTKEIIEPIVEPKEKIEPKAPSVEEALAEIARLKEHNEKLIGEKRKVSTEYMTLKEQQEAAKKQKLEEKGDYKGMLEEAQKQVDKLKAELSNKEELTLSKSVALSVQSLASDANDIEDIIEKIDINDDNLDMEKMEISDLSAQIDNLRKNKPYLFKKNAANMTTKLPGMSVNVTAKKDERPLKTRIAEQLLNKKK